MESEREPAPADNADSSSIVANGGVSLSDLHREVAELRRALAAAEVERRRDRERLRLVGEAAKVGIWEYSFIDDELYLSDECAALYDLTPQERNWPGFVQRLHPDDRFDDIVRPTPSFPFGQTNEFWLRVRHRDGRYLKIRSRSTTYGVDGVPVRKVGAHIDMTDDELLRLNQRLAEANRRLEQFGYMASHDLKSPMRSIAGLLTVAKLDLEDAEQPEQAAMLGDAMRHLGRMDRLVGDLLDYATSDLDDAERETVHLAEVVTEIAATIDTAGCDVAVNQSEPVEVEAVPLTVCVRNLIDNACKHHHRESGTVSVTAEVEDRWLSIAVQDDGPGIPDDVQAKIFEAFYTSDRTRSTGLGLTHTRETIEKYHGTFELESAEGSGTTFTIRWPLQDQAS